MQVLAVLSADPESRNSDSRLICTLWKSYNPNQVANFGQGDMVKLEDIIYKLPKFSSVERARRIIQNDLALYPPTDPKIAKKRRIKEEHYREAMRHNVSYADAKKILEIYLGKTKPLSGLSQP